MRISFKFLNNFELRAELFPIHLFINRENIINFGLFKKLFIFLFRPVGLIYKSRIFLWNHFERVAVNSTFEFGYFNVRGAELNFWDIFNFDRLECVWLFHVEKTRIFLFLPFKTIFFVIF